MSYEINFGINLTGPRWGVKFNGSNPGTRTYDAENLQFTPSNTTTTGVDDFITIKDSPFAIKECATKYNSSTGKQEILAYEGDINYSSAISDSDHNVMIEFPKFYYRRASTWEWIVSTVKLSNYKPSPMHYRNGVMYDKIYVSKYISDSNYLSQSSKSPLTYTTIGTFRNNFRSKGMYVIDYATICSINILMFIKYAHMNIGNLIGMGYVTPHGITYPSGASSIHTSCRSTGGADNVKGKDGYSGSAVNSDASIIAMGIEDYWGNLYSWLDGIVGSNGTQVYINTNIENIATNPTLSDMGDYKLVNTPCAARTSNTDSMMWNSGSMIHDAIIDWAQYPKVGLAVNQQPSNWDWERQRIEGRRLYSQSNYFINDAFWAPGSDNKIYLSAHGGNFETGHGSGPLCLDLFESDTGANGSRGAKSICFI